MDQIKIGRFIKALRKEKSLTQRELSELLDISEKTVSKWETGNGLPEVSLMLPLCKMLNITVNELLSGERLDEKSYIQKAEENIVSLATDRTKPITKTVIAAISCILSILLSMAIVLTASFVEMPSWARIVLISAAFVLIFCNIALVLVVAVNTEIFTCDKKKKKFVPSLSAYILGPHTFRRRYLKCPYCGNPSWCHSRIRKL